MSPAITFGEGDLFEYNPRYRLLICRECQYAIQKSALESHLLRHKIYRGDRQRLLSSIAQLDLLEPDYVPLPAPNSPPVDALPVLSGYRCPAGGCQHLAASSKRMKRHQSECHGLDGTACLPSARPVKLQTFFRGTKLRYFEVASPRPSQVHDDDDDDGDEGAGDDDGVDNPRECDEDNGRKAAIATSPSPSHPSAHSEASHSPSPADFNLETLTYLHHFIATTSLTLPGAEHVRFVDHYWQMHVISRALRRHWLMCGLLAISAHHVARLADDTMTEHIHREREKQFLSHFSAGLEQKNSYDMAFENEKREEVRKIGDQIKCLLCCAQWEGAKPAHEYESVDPCRLLTIMQTIRGCVVQNSLIPYGGSRNIDHQGQGGSSFSELQQMSATPRDVPPRTNSSGDNTPPILISRLRALPFRIAEGLGKPESAQDVLATLSAIDTMVECCHISFSCDEVGTASQGVATWLTNVPDYFNQMLSQQHPAALVVVAHWAAILVKRAERVGCWFWKGSAKIIVLHVARYLSANGQAVLGLVESLMGIVNA